MQGGKSFVLLIVNFLAFLVPEIHVFVRAKEEGTCSTRVAIRNASCLEKRSPAVQDMAGVRIEPEKLDLGYATLGSVIVRYIQVHSNNNSLKLLKTVPTDPRFFYLVSSEFAEGGVPLYKMRLALVPKIIGIIDTMLTIYTSFGEASLPVEARLAPSPFRVFPIEHPRIPINTNFSTDVVLYNPFDIPLLIERIYLSGGPFRLFLPDSLQLPVNQRFLPRKTDYWEIPPFESHVVATIIMDTLRSFHEQSFMRVKFNNTLVQELLIPIDVTFTKDTGLYSVDGILQFGVRRANDQPSRLPLRVRLTENNTAVNIDDIIDESANAGVQVEILQTSVTDFMDSTTIAIISLHSDVYYQNSVVEGNLIVKSSGEDLIISYRALILTGNIIPVKDSHLWHMPVNREDISVETLLLRNEFDYPVVVFNVNLIHSKAFSELEIVNPLFPTTLAVGEDTPIASFKIVIRSRITHSVTVRIVTSLGVFEIPIKLFAGDLRVDVSGMVDLLNDGLVIGKSVKGHIWLHNNNPVAIPVEELTLWSECFKIHQLALCDPSGSCQTDLPDIVNTINLESGFSLQILLVTKDMKNEGTYNSQLQVKTQFQMITTKLDTVVTAGRIELYQPEGRVIVSGLFPSGFVQRNLTFYNSFDKDITILKVLSEEFPMLKLIPSPDGLVITPRSTLSFDTLCFDARELCRDLPGLCYAGFDLDNTSDKSESWKRPFRVINYSSVEIDRRVRDRQKALWTSRSYGNNSFEIETTLKITTMEKYIFHLPITLSFVWPPPMISTLFEKLLFPLMSTGNFTEIDIEVTNPSDKAIFIHAYVFKDDKAQTWNPDVFYVKSIVPKGTTTGYYNVDDKRLPANVRLPTPARGSAASVVPSRGNFLVKVGFHPKMASCYNGVLYIRSSLDWLE